MSEKEALTGGLAGRWQSHMYLSEDAKRPLAHATRSYKNWRQIRETSRIRTLNYTVTITVRYHSANVTLWDEIKSLHRVYIH